ncbi:hypothetical protein DNTS_009745, partial [Danionella cerebrum]
MFVFFWGNGMSQPAGVSDSTNKIPAKTVWGFEFTAPETPLKVAAFGQGAHITLSAQGSSAASGINVLQLSHPVRVCDSPNASVSGKKGVRSEPSPLVQMADGRQPEDRTPQWSSAASHSSSSPGGHGENGFSTSYRSCQPGGTHTASASGYAKENGFNGDLNSGHAVTAEQVSARIVQEVTAEAVAVLKGEQELHPELAVRLPSVEDSANLPPSPPPSPAAEHFGPLDQDVGDEEEAGPLHRFQNSRERCKFLAPSISVSVPEDEPYHSDEEYYDHPLFSPEWTRSGPRPAGQPAAFRQIQ